MFCPCHRSFRIRENKKLFGIVYGSRVTDELLRTYFNNIQIYDLAGQAEFYSSHSAMLELLCLESPAVFVMMVDLTKSEEQLSKEIYNWSNFLEVQSSNISSHVIVVGSRKDKLLSKPQLLSSKCKFVEDTAKDALEKQHFAGFVALDSRQLSSENAKPFLSILTNSISELRVSGVKYTMSFACCVLRIFLSKRVKVNAVSFDSLQKLLSCNSAFSPLSDPTTLASSLRTLAERGFILFIHHSSHLSSSCIIINARMLLQEINGTLFAPTFFKEHRPIASNTGIVPVSLLHQIFPHYERNILVAMMTSLQFCRPVEPALLTSITTNLSPDSTTNDQYLYFPALVSVERPHCLSISKGFGWFMYCTNPRKCLTRRCIDALLLDLPYNFCLSMPALPKLEHPNEVIIRKLNRSCTVWKNGVHWTTEDGTQAMVHITEENRCVSLVVSFDQEHPADSLELRSSVIDAIRTKQKELCSTVEVHEYLISPSQLSHIPNRNFSQLTVFAMEDVTENVMQQKQFVLDVHRRERISLESLLHFHPSQVIPPAVMQQLLASKKSGEPVPAILFAGKSPQVSDVPDGCAWSSQWLH